MVMSDVGSYSGTNQRLAISVSDVNTQGLHLRVPAVTVFDWDDVLCPTTFVGQFSARESETNGSPAATVTNNSTEQLGHPVLISSSEMAQLRMVETGVVHVLRAALRHGPVAIVTNADEHWVRSSMELFLKGAIPVLRDVEVVGARARFEGDFPNQPTCWKIAAFSYIANRHFKPHQGHHDGAGVLLSVISGTGRDEKSATRTLSRHHQQVITKTVSLLQHPTPPVMRKQLDLLAANFGWIYGLSPSPTPRTGGPRPAEPALVERPGVRRPELEAPAKPLLASKQRVSRPKVTFAIDRAKDRLAEERLVGERLAEERLAGERLAGERLAGERLAAEAIAEEDAVARRKAGADLGGLVGSLQHPGGVTDVRRGATTGQGTAD
ncbi:unnamed protein product [Discosporangium mesarthrocarpum]